MSAGDPRVARTASEASGLALLASSGLDRAPGSVASRAIGGSTADDDLPRSFPPESAVFTVHNPLMAELATRVGLEGAGCHRRRRRRLLGKLRFPVLDDGGRRKH